MNYSSLLKVEAFLVKLENDKHVLNKSLFVLVAKFELHFVITKYGTVNLKLSAVFITVFVRRMNRLPGILDLATLDFKNIRISSYEFEILYRHPIVLEVGLCVIINGFLDPSLKHMTLTVQYFHFLKVDVISRRLIANMLVGFL